MQKPQRIAALEQLIQHHEKCRNDLTMLDQSLRGGSGEEPVDDILALNEQTLQAVEQSLHVAYARLEREHSRGVAVRSRSAVPFAGLGVALQ